MGIGYIFGIAFGLSMDAFAVSITSGARTKANLLQRALLMALFFGAFQALMPALGWLAGASLQNLVASYDHWIAFTLLAGLGGKMIYEAFGSDEGEGKEGRSLGFCLLVSLSIATSIDALIVGFSMSCLRTGILLPITIIGAVTFIISALGVWIGHHFGRILGNKCEFVGGLVLIGLGVKVLLLHLAPGLTIAGL